MGNERKLNRNATIENIRNSGMIDDVEQFNIEVQKEDSDQFIIDAAMFCDVKVVYEK